MVALGPVMRTKLLGKGVAERRIVEISNWATGPIDAVAEPPGSLRSQWGLEGAFVLLYSGNLGIGHEFETLLEGVAQALPRCPNLRVVFVGKGSRLEEVKAAVQRLGLQLQQILLTHAIITLFITTALVISLQILDPLPPVRP